MEPKKIFNDKIETPVKQVIVKETSEKQLTIIINPKSAAAENVDTPQKLFSHENRDKKLSENTRSLAPRRMESPVKLLDENFEFNNAALEYLTDSSIHYLVVAVIGMQGVGKSMILNLIAQSKPISNLGEYIVRALFKDVEHATENEDNDYEYDDSSDNVEETDNAINNHGDFFKFKIQSFRDIISNSGCTKGVDMYVTEDRLILLDCQALWSLTNDDSHTNLLSSRNTDPIVGALQVASYLMSISHVVITVMDWYTDHSLMRYLHAADMLRPTLSPPVTIAEGEDTTTSTTGENKPHLLLVCNKCAANQPSSESMAQMQEAFRKTFLNTKLQLCTGMHLYRDAYKNVGRRGQINNQEPTEKPINMFMLPEILDSTHGTRKYYNDYTFEQLVSRLRESVMSASRHPISVPNLGERGWLHFASKAWETVKKCPFFLEYESFLP